MNSNGILSIFLRSLTYPLTRLSALATGLIVGLSCLLIVGLFLIPGYAIRCGRHVLKGDLRLPTWEKGDGSLLNDGAQALVIIFEYNVTILVISFAIRLLLGSIPAFAILDPYLSLSAAGLATFIVTLPLVILSGISLVIFADWNDLGRALNPLNALGLLLARPIAFLKATVVDYVALNILSIPTLLMGAISLTYRDNLSFFCLWFLAMLLVMCCMSSVNYPVRMYIWARYYAMTIGDIEDEQEARTSAT